MEILDGKNHAGGRYERFIRDMILHLLNGEETRWGVLNWPIPELNLPSASQRKVANSAFIIRLRAFVDGFIQTGIDSNGVETPSSRRVRASVDEPPILTVSADEPPVSIFDEIYESFRRNQPRPLLNGNGTIAIGANQPRWENQAPELYARDMATYYFQELLASSFGAASASAQIRFANDTSFANAKGRRQSSAAATAGAANLSAARRGLG
jgi:hypothetical protein